jgi:hypothetical protein
MDKYRFVTSRFLLLPNISTFKRTGGAAWLNLRSPGGIAMGRPLSLVSISWRHGLSLQWKMSLQPVTPASQSQVLNTAVRILCLPFLCDRKAAGLQRGRREHPIDLVRIVRIVTGERQQSSFFDSLTISCSSVQEYLSDR